MITGIDYNHDQPQMSMAATGNPTHSPHTKDYFHTPP